MHPDEPASLAGAVTSASLCDAMSRRHGHRCHVVGLTPASAGLVTAGSAATIRFGPRRDDLPDHDLAQAATHALADVPPGGIVLIAAPDAPGEAVAGGKKLAAIEEAGIIGPGYIRLRRGAGALVVAGEIAVDLRVGGFDGSVDRVEQLHGRQLAGLDHAARLGDGEAGQVHQLSTTFGTRNSPLPECGALAVACSWVNLSRGTSARKTL